MKRWLVYSCFVMSLVVVTAVVVASGSGIVDATTSHGHVIHNDSKFSATPRSVEAYVTYYGWYDNTPPGCATAYSGCAKGTGTYEKPITFASYVKEFPVGTIVYYPTVEKYFVMGDLCQECQADWTGKGPDGGPHLYHLDLWIGGKGGNEFDVINCEDGLTQGMPDGAPLLTPLIIDPPSDLPVSTEALFNPSNNHCFGGAQTGASYGRYQNRRTGDCLANPGDSSTSGTPVVAAPCSGSADEDLAFEGAFFTINNLCLETRGSNYGSELEWSKCTGGPFQQWETGSDGTIAWIQYLRCIGDIRGTVELVKCQPGPDNEWYYRSEKRPAN